MFDLSNIIIRISWSILALNLMKKIKYKVEKKHSIFNKIFHWLLRTIIILLICIVFSGLFIYSKIENNISTSIEKSNKIISKMSDSDFNSRTETNIYDKDGNLIKKLKTVDYIYKSYNDLNPNVFKAVIAVEDNRFYEHDGIDLKGLFRALYSSIVLHNTQGGSTITQQLAKNVYLTMDQSIWRKISEAIIAQELETRYSKHQILEFYVNNINYGNGCYSIESAANYYFNKNTTDLSIGEIALLTGIPNNPTVYDPITNFDNAIKKKNSILYKMYKLNMLSEKEYNDEKNREIILKVNESEINNVVTDYAQSYAVHEAVEFLMSYYGFQFKYDFNDEEERTTYWNSYDSEYKYYYNELISGGYDIYTSIDQNIQNTLQEVVNSQMSIYTDINETTGLYNKQAAATVIDNNTGLVIGIVGGRTQDGVNNSYNRAFLSARQPGSTIKPIIVYTPAIEKGYNANSVLVDEMIPNGPKNAYSGYIGNVSLRNAVAQSINTVAYKLTQEIGIENSLKYLSNMKYKYLSSIDKQSTTIGLGGFTYGVTTVEMASAYSTLSRNGQYIDATNITKIYDRTTKTIIYENTYETKKIYDDGAAYLMTDVLKTVMTSGTGRGFKLSNISEQAGKTGTTNDEKDLWFCGYTPSYSMSVWMGNDTPSSQGELSTQGYIWNQMMTILNQGKNNETFKKPDSVYNENGTLKYKKNKKDSKLSKNTELENQRIQLEKNEIKEFKYRNQIIINDSEQILQTYINLFNNSIISDSKQFPIFMKYIENADKIKNKVSNPELLNIYEQSKSSIQNQIQTVKDSYEYQNKEQELNQKNTIWQNIINDFYNRKPEIILPNEKIDIKPIIPSDENNKDVIIDNNNSNEDTDTDKDENKDKDKDENVGIENNIQNSK